MEEQQVDVGPERQLASPVATDGDDGDAEVQPREVHEVAILGQAEQLADQAVDQVGVLLVHAARRDPRVVEAEQVLADGIEVRPNRGVQV